MNRLVVFFFALVSVWVTLRVWKFTHFQHETIKVVKNNPTSGKSIPSMTSMEPRVTAKAAAMEPLPPPPPPPLPPLSTPAESIYSVDTRTTGDIRSDIVLSNAEMYEKCAVWSAGDEKKRRKCFKALRLARQLGRREAARKSALASLEPAQRDNAVLLDYLIDLQLQQGAPNANAKERAAREADSRRFHEAWLKQSTPDQFFHDSLNSELQYFQLNQHKKDNSP